MIRFQISHKPLSSHAVDAYVLVIPEGFVFDEQLQEIATRWYPPLEHWLAKYAFSGACGDVVVASGADLDTPVTLICVGMGSLGGHANERIERYRRALGNAMRAAERVKAASLLIRVPDPAIMNCDAYTLGRETISTCDIAAYQFEQFFTDASRKRRSEYDVVLWAREEWHAGLRVGAEHGSHIGYAVNQARHWCDLPPCILTPTHLAEQAERIARAHNLSIKVFTKSEILKMGMGGIIGVSQGSAQECRFVVLEYRPNTKEKVPSIAIVGKGVTFDSGGISIKPAARMDEMKDDMAGAAAVISTMELCAHLKPNVHVVAAAPLVENMPSGTALRPGDVIQFYNGMTAEIKNTDAEGRLILADALSYVVKHYEVDAIVNLATLTGSCAAALGPFYCGLMSKHDELSQRVLDAGAASGDRAWRLPFSDDYKAAVRSNVADLCNEGSATYRAGAITAGFFLKPFVGAIPWVHLDIAGTSFNVPNMSYYRPGATGFGVRLLGELLMKY